MKLLSMVDFVLEEDLKASNGGHYDRIVRYAKFLNQPLKLEMFVPCDKEGNPLVKPSLYDPRSKTGNTEIQDLVEANYNYLKGQEKVLFEGFKVKYIAEQSGAIRIGNKDFTITFFNKYISSDSIEGWVRTVEDMSSIDLTLTTSTLKQLGYSNQKTTKIDNKQ